MKKIFILFFVVSGILTPLFSQINEADGLNLPGSWDSWNNPPSNPVFLSHTEGGQVNLIDVLQTSIYQTFFEVSSSGDLTAGSYDFLFTSPAYGDPWGNKWADVSVSLNTIQEYVYYTSGGSDNSITLNDNKWYVMNWENTGYNNTRAIFMELSSEPISINSTAYEPFLPTASDDVTVTVEASSSPNTDEYVYIRYTIDNWSSDNLIEVNFSGTTGTATIPAQADQTQVQFYVFSTVANNPTQDFHLYTIDYDNNSGSYYEYTVGEELSCDGEIGVLTSDPVFPLHDGPVTITFDATLGNGALMDYSGDVYAHTGLITSESQGNNDWQHVISEWGVNDPEFLFTQVGDNLYQWQISNIRDFYDVPANEDIYKIAMVIRSDDPINPDEPDVFYVARNADGSDFHLDVYDEGINVKILNPSKKEPLVPLNSLIPVCVYAMDANSITLNIDGNQVAVEDTLEMVYGLYTGDYDPGMHEIIADAYDGYEHAYDTTWFYIRDDVVVEDLPADVENGINYIDDNTVTFVLHEPEAEKEFAFVIGDFNNWTASDDGYMKRTPDGQYFWTTITGLTPGTEYAYQYYIDGELKLADPYCEKILDPWNDRWIPETTYPNLKEYPWDQTIGIVSVIETGQEPYNWVIDDFNPVATGSTQSNLVIYELLIRDFVESRDIKDVIDTLDYLKNLGVNAIELMPIQEFDGNDSWGYAPNFYFATDKAYGTENNYKQFIDECHQRDIAVILDVVYNHNFGLSPLVQMYWDENNNQPAANNPWFNQQATHPYSVGYDLNHENQYTKELVKRNLEYWLTEFKIDGFRFDLSKGLTQTYSANVSDWSNYDQSRIDIITDYYNHIKSINSDAYVILEHFADNDEEIELANTGCLMWGVMSEQFNQNTMGYNTNHDFSWAYYGERGFSYPNLIPYMESHDEERIMYNNLAYGNGFAGDTITSLSRTEPAVAMYMTIPGPKMMWQFGELGYDESIELCWDGTYSEDCRTASKPVHWEYTDNYYRQKLFWTYAGMIKLKTQNSAFLNGSFSQDLSGMGKRMWIDGADMDVSVSANFDVNGFDMAPGFQHTGTWYNYFTGESIDVTDPTGHTLYYEPGDYYVFTDVQLDRPYLNLTFNVKNLNNQNIENATVTIDGYGFVNTNSNGNAQFLYATNATVNYNVSASGYMPENGTINLNTQDHTENIILQPTYLQNNDDSDILLYPNPADDFVSVKANYLYQISVFDISGKCIKQISMNNKNQNIDLSGFNSGVYTLLFKNDMNIEVKKMIIK